MSDWRFFVNILKGYKHYFHKPKVVILDDRNKNEDLKKHPDAWAVYNPDEVKIFILADYNCVPVRIHEYGHWINACIYFILEIVWEFFWWGLGIRKMFGREDTSNG